MMLKSAKRNGHTLQKLNKQEFFYEVTHAGSSGNDWKMRSLPEALI